MNVWETGVMRLGRTLHPVPPVQTTLQEKTKGSRDRQPQKQRCFLQRAPKCFALAHARPADPFNMAVVVGRPLSESDGTGWEI